MTTTIQRLHSAHEVADKNIVPAAFTAVPMPLDVAPVTGLPLAVGAERQAMEAHLSSEPLVVDKVEKSAFEDDPEICDEKVSAPQQNHLDDHPITPEEEPI